MSNDKIEKFLEIGEEIINNAFNEKEKESLLKVIELDSLTSFLLGSSLILYGMEHNEEGCEQVVGKALALIEDLSAEVKFYN